MVAFAIKWNVHCGINVIKLSSKPDAAPQDFGFELILTSIKVLQLFLFFLLSRFTFIFFLTVKYQN
jgi:hypothetical protein